MTSHFSRRSRPVLAAVLGSLLAAAVRCRRLALSSAPQPPRSAPRRAANRPDTLKERDKELEAIRAEQRSALENEAKLKREIESIGDDRRKLNQQLIDTAARVRQRRGAHRPDPGAPQAARRAARRRCANRWRSGAT